MESRGPGGSWKLREERGNLMDFSVEKVRRRHFKMREACRARCVGRRGGSTGALEMETPLSRSGEGTSLVTKGHRSRVFLRHA